MLNASQNSLTVRPLYLPRFVTGDLSKRTAQVVCLKRSSHTLIHWLQKRHVWWQKRLTPVMNWV